MKTRTAIMLDISDGLLRVDGHAGALRCSSEFSDSDGNERKRKRRKFWRGEMNVACSSACPGTRRRHGELWKALDVDVSSTAGSVSFHRAAWRRGAGKKTPVPLVGRVGWLGRLRPGRLVSLF